QQVSAFGDPSLPFCPTDSQVGVVEPGVFGFFRPGTGYKTPLFNLDAPGGNSRIVARLGFIGVFYPIFIDIKLDPKRDDALTATIADIPATGTYASYTKLWAVPSDSSHDAERLNWIQAALCGLAGICPEPLESGVEPTPFMDNPTSCGPAEVGQAATSYQREEGADFGIFSLPNIEGCEAVPFEPTMSLEPTTRSAGASSGLEASLHIPQEGLTDPETLVTSHLKE